MHLKLKRVIAQSHLHDTFEQAEDNLAGMKTIPGYMFGVITKEKNKFITTGYFDIEGVPVFRSKQREAWIETEA